ncbi:hypothetical protein T484DRAFT_1832771, partial [Baffinella frigidus]
VLSLRRLSDRSGNADRPAPEAGPSGSQAGPSGEKKSRKFQVGDKVKAKWKNKFRFNGRITECHADGTYRVKFDDGDEGSRTAEAHISFQTTAEAHKSFQTTAEAHISFQTFTVSLRSGTSLPEFIVPLFRYHRNDSHLWAPGDRFRMRFEGDLIFGGIVRAVKPIDRSYPASPWSSLEVKWDDAPGQEGAGDDDEEEEHYSPWEVMAPSNGSNGAEELLLPTWPPDAPASGGGGPASGQADGPAALPLKERIARVLDEAVARCGQPFTGPLPEAAEHFPGLLAHVPLPVTLDLVRARLGTGLYR